MLVKQLETRPGTAYESEAGVEAVRPPEQGTSTTRSQARQLACMPNGCEGHSDQRSSA